MLKNSMHTPAGHSADTLAGECLANRYELLDSIGQGGMSTVYRARDRALDRAVAVKVIRHDPALHGDRARMRERFRREAANAARIPPHPNVVQVYDYGTDADRDLDFIVMELLAGSDLKEALRERQLTVDESVRIILGAARGLSAGHRAGIVHRDVKPANILLAEQGGEESVRVLDFGIAKALGADPEDDLTRLGGVPHTPAYASPEQQRPGAALSAASDVYQLGLVAYELLAGARPFDADARERICGGQDLPLPVRGRWLQVPSPLRAVVERALRSNPADRFADASAFAEAWSRAPSDDHTIAAPIATAPPIVHDATVALDPPRAESAGAWATARERWGALPREARIAAAAVVAVLLLWVLLRGGDEPTPVVETAETMELEERFAPLYREAAERLEEEGR